jgi:hypothetical protein
MSYLRNQSGLSFAVAVAALVIGIFGVIANATAAQFEVLPGSFSTVTHNQNGTPDTQAGDHPFAVTSSFELATVPDPRGGNARVPTGANLRTANVALPPGLVGNPYAVPQCTSAEFLQVTNFFHICSDNAQIGIATAKVNFYGGSDEVVKSPIYNLTPGAGQPAAFGFWVINVPVILVPHLRSDGDYGLTVEGSNLDESLPVLAVSVTFWGVPASEAHTSERNDGFGLCSSGEAVSPPCLSTVRPQAFLTSPVDCAAGPLTTTLFAESWQGETDTQSSTPASGMTGCNRVPFAPSIVAQPSIGSAETPSGLKFELEVPSEGILNPTGVAQAEIKKAVVRLPEGMTINPSAGEGLVGCTPADYAREALATLPGEGCPNPSKLGTVKIDTPLLNEALEGSLFLAEPDNPATSTPGAENPFDSLLAIYVVARLPERGIIVKAAGKIVPDPRTGQLVATFDNLPQLPFSKFTMTFREGQRSALATPAVCGTYSAKAELTPWSAANLDNPSAEEVANVESTFRVTSGVGGGACPSGGTPPFAPQINAGTLNNAAGSASPVDIRITRGDGEQEITGFSSQLPTGLTAKLAGVPFCSEADIALAKTKTGGQEEAEPSCPAASQIGHTLVGAGVGSVLVYTPGRIYLAGPYEGAPFSIVSITSAVVGPFDIGTVVVHLPLQIDPLTAAVTVDAGAADQIPHIIDGIVIHVRDIRVYIDRPDFTLNPTSCARKTFAATVIGSGANFADAADDVPVTVTNPFQAADCADLAFKPVLKASSLGRTSRANGASLSVKLTYPKAPEGTQANIRSVKVELPKKLPSRLTTLQKACTAAQFNANPAGCPPASVVGHARAITPILPVALEGPAYFVSHGGEAFPSLILVLQGYGLTIDLVGSTNINGKTGITSSTFKSVPDQPVTSFELTLPEGPYSALAANGNLCRSKLAMPTVFVGQNGDEMRSATPIAVTGCRKSKKATRAKAHKPTKALGACRKDKQAKRGACEKGQQGRRKG